MVKNIDLQGVTMKQVSKKYENVIIWLKFKLYLYIIMHLFPLKNENFVVELGATICASHNKVTQKVRFIVIS